MDVLALTPNEVAVTQMALTTMIEGFEENKAMPYTPEAKMMIREMRENAQSAFKKLVLVSGHEIKMEPYKEGDEIEFLTKISETNLSNSN